MEFGDRLKVLRKERRISQKELAHAINVSARVIGYYETNQRFPKDARTLTAIADFLGVSLDYLLGEELPTRFSYDALLEIAKMHFRLATPEQQTMIFNSLTNIYIDNKKEGHY